MTVIVAGATGFVGGHVVPALRAAGHTVRSGTRDPRRAAVSRPGEDWIRLEVNDDASLQAALEGANALVYLVHQMRGHGDDLVAEERASGERVRRIAEATGVERIVYLGGPRPIGGAPSAHLAARLATGEVLRGGPISTIELQAGMIIGVGSESWLIVRDLALRLPIMVLPRWLSRRSQPIGIDDVVSAIVRSVTYETRDSLCLPLPGPETLSAREVLLRIAATQGMRPVMVPVPVLTPSLSSHWIRWVTRADYGIARQLVDGLTCDLVAADPDFWSLCPDLPRTPLDDAIRAALAEEPFARLPAWQRRWERLARALSLSPPP
jgi:uncharacterized protein YbjT (DUF2867 family)